MPSDDMIVLASLIGAAGGWECADGIASVLRRLGFKITPQKMVGTLRRLLREDFPMFESRRNKEWRLDEYRVTRWGLNHLDARFCPGIAPLVREGRQTLEGGS